jgi:hypothetical protein
MDWFRKSELSSDRFSLLVTGDLETVQSVILRLAGGASSEKDELSTDEFRLQAKEFRETVEARKRGSIKDKIEYYTSSLMLQDAKHTRLASDQVCRDRGLGEVATVRFDRPGGPCRGRAATGNSIDQNRVE